MKLRKSKELYSLPFFVSDYLDFAEIQRQILNYIKTDIRNLQ